MIDKELVIWAAGVFDGEGCALIERTGIGRTSYQITVAVAGTDPRITIPIMEAWGGHYRATRDLNAIHHKDVSVRKLDCTVYFSRDEAKRFLADVYPYLRAKGVEARVVLRALCSVPGEAALAEQGLTRMKRGASFVLESFYNQLKVIRSNS